MKIKMGMVGGGQGAFIGAIHRMAAALDGNIEIVCGAFSSNHQKSIDFGLSLGLQRSRCYASYQTMLQEEQKLPTSDRIEAVIVVTPNHLHFDVTKQALQSGFHVICDKPATVNLDQAQALAQTIVDSNRLYALTHTYTGFPLVKKAKELITQGALGSLTKVIVEYHQGWLANKEAEQSKQASWRLDPKQAGLSCCMGDIGVHGANLAEYITSSEITDICAELNATLPHRLLDDDGLVMLKFANQAKGHLSASQVCTGEENNLRIRVYGSKASLDWSQQAPNTLWLKSTNEPTKQYRTGVGNQTPFITDVIRTPAGHPEGYIEAFANIYQNFVKQINAFKRGEIADVLASNTHFDVPGIEDAKRGMRFIEGVVKASQSNIKWHTI